MLALAHDFRVMRDDRGFLCLPEVDIKLPFATGMSVLITFVKPINELTFRTKITDPLTVRDAMILGKKFSAKEALSSRLIDAVYSEKELIPKGVELATSVTSKGR